MKRYLSVLILLCTVSSVQGAHFSYYAGGLRAYYEVYAQDPVYFDGPLDGTQYSTSYAFVVGTASVPQASSGARNDIWSETSNNSVRIQSYSTANGYASNSLCYASGWGFGRTQNSQTYGIYYKIMPDDDEQPGDDVMVYYNDMVNISADGHTYVRIGGPGTMDHIAITRGQLPPVPTEPNRDYEVLSFPQVEIPNSDGDWFSGIHAFPAKIGDVIGIFAENYTKVADWGPLNSEVYYSTHTMILTVRAVLSGDLDHDGDVDFFDLAKLANNWLEGVGGGEPPIDEDPPTPDPMQWADGGEPKETYGGGGTFDYYAEMTAVIAIDPSGGVQYYFECTDVGGFSSGWQGSPSYTVLVGGSGQSLDFHVKARDIHGNETGWSPTLPAD
jgi:hypothetical protein